MQTIGSASKSENINDIFSQAMNPIMDPLRTLAECFEPLMGYDAKVLSLSIEAEVR